MRERIAKSEEPPMHATMNVAKIKLQRRGGAGSVHGSVKGEGEGEGESRKEVETKRASERAE